MQRQKRALVSTAVITKLISVCAYVSGAALSFADVGRTDPSADLSDYLPSAVADKVSCGSGRADSRSTACIVLNSLGTA